MVGRECHIRQQLDIKMKNIDGVVQQKNEATTYLWWLEGVVRREMDVEEKDSSTIRRVHRPQDSSLPVE